MKLLILTQKIGKSDPNLGFFHAWIQEFARHCERVTVICLERGAYDLPENVKVFSLGKEEKNSRLAYVALFYKYVWRERKNYDAVLVHMNPEYVVLGGILWRMMGKKIALWYTHKNVDLKLRIAEKFSHSIFTASKESFRLSSKKVQVMGHGIEVEKFLPSKHGDFPVLRLNPQAGPTTLRRENSHACSLNIVTVGRVSPVKDYETLIRAATMLKQKNISFEVKIFGNPETEEQEKYLKSLRDLVSREMLEDRVRFMGAVSQDKLPSVLADADVFANMSHTGGLDKAVLEAMSCGLPVVTCNETFAPELKEYGLMFEKGNAENLAEKILTLESAGQGERKNIGRELRKIVEEKHSLEKLIPKIVESLCSNK